MPDVSCIIIEGPVLVHWLKSLPAQSFSDYSHNTFQAHLKRNNHNAKRMEVVFDKYVQRSLKTGERTQRGTGLRVRVKDSAFAPKNWSAFLQNSDNKAELFRYLGKRIPHMKKEESGIQTVCAYDDTVSSNCNLDVSSLEPCSQEEADTRMFLHAKHARDCGHRQILIQTVDSDVVVIAVYHFHRLQVTHLWIEYGTGNNRRFLPIHEITNSLGEIQSNALPFWHPFTGCDTVSDFAGRGKKTAWEVWRAFPSVSTTFAELTSQPVNVTLEHFEQLQRFTILLYDRSSTLQSINDCRRMLMTKKSRTYDSIPPTEGALLQHSFRAALQAGYYWSQALQKVPIIPVRGVGKRQKKGIYLCGPCCQMLQRADSLWMQDNVFENVQM